MNFTKESVPFCLAPLFVDREKGKSQGHLKKPFITAVTPTIANRQNDQVCKGRG